MSRNRLTHQRPQLVLKGNPAIQNRFLLDAIDPSVAPVSTSEPFDKRLDIWYNFYDESSSKRTTEPGKRLYTALPSPESTQYPDRPQWTTVEGADDNV